MSELLQATIKCDLRLLKDLLSGCRDVNITIPGTEGCTPLHIAVGLDTDKNKQSVIAYLLEKGANPNARSFEGLTPVHIAAVWNKCEELELLIEHGGNPWLTDTDNKNCFDLAVDNHSYEANNLLNRYLAEGKLNFRQRLRNPQPRLGNLDDTARSNKAYVSAYENFPLIFSSSSEESSSESCENSKNKCQNSTKIDKNDNNTISKTFPRLYPRLSPIKMYDNCENHILENGVASNNQNTVAAGDSDSQSLVIHNEHVNRSNNDKHIDERPERVGSEVESDMYQSGSDSETRDEIFHTLLSAIKMQLSSRLQANDTESSGEEEFQTVVLESDEESCILLVEKSACHVNPTSSEQSSTETDSSSWKDHQSWSTSLSFSQCSSHANSLITIPVEYKRLNNSDIFRELKKFGDDPGPVTYSTRDLYLRRLMRLKMGCATSCVLPVPKFPSEVYKFVDGTLNADHSKKLLDDLEQEFVDIPVNLLLREGNSRCCFNYFLLDPRVTLNLPEKAKNSPSEKHFLTFLDSIFYIGKGTKERPYSHLIEAAKLRQAQHKSDKIAHILDIWSSGYGVVSLHCFHNCRPVEAYTQEAAMIEAVGLQNLTNIKAGDYYGKPAKWRKSWKRQAGVLLLDKAFRIFLIEGEKQILLKDIRCAK